MGGHFAAALALLLALSGCSGHARRGKGAEPPAAGGEAASEGDGAGGALSERGGSAEGGALAGHGGSAEGGAPAATTGGNASGGAGGAVTEVSGDGSGTEFCVDHRDCADELSCVGLPGEPLGRHACLRECSSSEPCMSAEVCLSGGQPVTVLGCVPRCVWPRDCSFGFDCIDSAGTGDYVCVPAPWSSFFLEKP